jgi:hypothetical protein
MLNLSEDDVIKLAYRALGQSAYIVPTIQWWEAEEIAVRVLAQLERSPEKYTGPPRLI